MQHNDIFYILLNQLGKQGVEQKVTKLINKVALLARK